MHTIPFEKMLNLYGFIVEKVNNFTGDMITTFVNFQIFKLIGDYQRNKKSFYIENLARKPNDDAHMKTLMQLTKNNS